MTQDSGGDVERRFTQGVERCRKIQELGCFLVNRNGLAGGRIDLVDDIAGNVAAELVFDSPGFFCDQHGKCVGLCGRSRLTDEFARAPHRLESAGIAIGYGF